MSFHEQFMKEYQNYQSKLADMGVNINLPAPSMLELQLEYLSQVPDQSITARLPFQKRFTNPVGLYQGGILAAGMDDVFGPLSYSAAKGPCVTLSMNVTYMRPFSAEDGEVIIEGKILQKTKTFIFMRAEVKNPKGQLIATADSHVTILRQDQLQKVKA